MASVLLENVSKRYGDSWAVDGVSLKIASGEFITLLGPSGCGKTTTLRIVAGLASPENGRVAINEVDVTRTPTHLRNIGMVFQSHALFPHMTIADNVGFGLKMRGVNRSSQSEQIKRALELVRLSEFGTRFPAQLSGGQQQRVALARALVFDPHVLLLDEPFGALDRKLRETLQVELRELTRRIGITAIFVTHDQEEALVLSDRIAVMRAGKLEQVAAPQQLFEHPSTRFVADFMGFGNILEGAVAGVSDGRATISIGGLNVETTVAEGEKIGERVAVAIRAERIYLSPPDRDQVNALPGVVTDAIYQGTATTYRIQLDQYQEGQVTVREVAQAGGSLRFEVGSRVQASWSPEAVQLLRS